MVIRSSLWRIRTGCSLRELGDLGDLRIGVAVSVLGGLSTLLPWYNFSGFHQADAVDWGANFVLGFNYGGNGTILPLNVVCVGVFVGALEHVHVAFRLIFLVKLIWSLWCLLPALLLLCLKLQEVFWSLTSKSQFNSFLHTKFTSIWDVFAFLRGLIVRRNFINCSTLLLPSLVAWSTISNFWRFKLNIAITNGHLALLFGSRLLAIVFIWAIPDLVESLIFCFIQLLYLVAHISDAWLHHFDQKRSKVKQAGVFWVGDPGFDEDAVVGLQLKVLGDVVDDYCFG